MTWCMFASDQSDIKRIHKVRRVPLLTYTVKWFKFKIEKGIKYEVIVSQFNTLCQQ